MSQKNRSVRRSLLRATDRVFDFIGIRPLGIIVFLSSLFFLVQLVGISNAVIRVEAVAVGAIVEHPSLVASFATGVFVQPGDHVEIGTPLVELSSHFVDQKIARIDSDMEQLINEYKLAQARLLVKEERWVEPSMRLRPNRPSLEDPTSDLYEKQLDALRSRRNMLINDRSSLVVRSSYRGIVREVTRVGSSVAEGESVAAVMPEFAEEIVAFVKPTTDPDAIATGAPVIIVGAKGLGCDAVGLVRRRGATVSEAPPQLRNFLGGRIHGMPIHISVPASCQLGNGQVVTLDFIRDGVT